MNNFTPRAQQVLALARKEADRFNHNYVGTEHLLLGLIKLGQGVAVSVLLKLGLESGSQAVLDAMAKGISLELMERTLGALSRAGIATYVYLLFGTPGESPEAARETLAFTAGHHRCITFLNLAIFNLPPGTYEPATAALVALFGEHAARLVLKSESIAELIRAWRGK